MRVSRLIMLMLLVLGLQTDIRAAREFQTTAVALSDQVGVGDRYADIRWLGALQLANVERNGLDLCGLSGLAWDEDTGLLYALSDRGALFHLRPEFDDRGYLTGAQLVAVYALRDGRGTLLRSPFTDSEGLAILKGDNGVPADTELLVSFEARPRVVRYSPTGRWLGETPLPAMLHNVRNYREANQSLEAITVDRRWGIVVGTEASLRNRPDGQVPVFASSGRFWNYPLGTAPGSALVAMEALPDGSLLTLERAFVSPLRPLVISLRRTELTASTQNAPLSVTDVAVFDSTEGWRLDNFEGLTRYRDRRFFMVSDDNCHAWQTTLLVYFEWASSLRGPL